MTTVLYKGLVFSFKLCTSCLYTGLSKFLKKEYFEKVLQSFKSIVRVKLFFMFDLKNVPNLHRVPFLQVQGP